MQIALLIFDNLTTLDAIGPLEVVSRLPDAEVKVVAKSTGPVRAGESSGHLGLIADYALDEVSEPDILVVPGGYGTRELVNDADVVGWIRDVHQTTTWTTSVCTGSLLLAAAGVLDGIRATTHWRAMDLLADLGAIPTKERVVIEGKIITAAGVSSGIDMALHLAALVVDDDFAQAIQLQIEYDPQPPFDSGSVDKAPEAVLKLVGGIS